jgi:hypothetical protein
MTNITVYTNCPLCDKQMHKEAFNGFDLLSCINKSGHNISLYYYDGNHCVYTNVVSTVKSFVFIATKMIYFYQDEAGTTFVDNFGDRDGIKTYDAFISLIQKYYKIMAFA